MAFAKHAETGCGQESGGLIIRKKDSSNLRDHKRYHVQCCRGWLQKYRDRDLEAVQEHLLTCDPNFEAMWLSVQSALLGTSAASSTG